MKWGKGLATRAMVASLYSGKGRAGDEGVTGRVSNEEIGRSGLVLVLDLYPTGIDVDMKKIRSDTGSARFIVFM